MPMAHLHFANSIVTDPEKLSNKEQSIKMDLFSSFCNICYKTDDGLKDISEEKMKHLKHILITLVGHADIVKHNIIYLCQMCCEELTTYDKFRKKCFNNLIELRQRYFNMKFKLELEEDADTVKNTLKKFIHEEVLRGNSTEKSGRNEYKFDGDYHEVSDINNLVECNLAQVAITNEEDMNNEIVRRAGTKLAILQRESNEDFSMSDINNDSESVTPQIQFIKQEFGLENEKESSDSGLKLKKFRNESGEAIVNSAIEERSSEGLELETTKASFEFVNISTSAHMLDNVKNKPTAAVMKPQPSHLHGQSATASESGAPKRENPGADPHTCAICNEFFKTSSCASTHRCRDSSARYRCTLCTKTFAESYNLVVHERTHSGHRPYKCTICDKSFTQSSSLNTHKRTHSGERPYKCTICYKTFAQLSCFSTHKRTHTGDRPYACTVCNKTFKQSCTLNRHARTHSGERPYECTICDRTFVDLSAFVKHKRIHSGDKPYVCTICNKTFTQSSSLSTHKRTHNADKPYQCTVCNKTFKESCTLIRHERTHSDDGQCVYNNTFTDSSDLTKSHGEDRPYECNNTATQSSTSYTMCTQINYE